MGKVFGLRGMNREIMALAVPNILSNISIPLLGSVDVALMGGLGSLELGAVGLATMIFNFIYWNFGFLRMGTTGLTAQAFGRKDQAAQSTNLYQGLLVALIIAGVVILFKGPFLIVAGNLLEVQSNQELLVSEYFNTRIWAAPATLMLYVFFGWFFGMQNAVYPLILTLVINVINIACSYYLVIEVGWGIKGVAMGTVIAQYMGVVVAVLLCLWRYRRRLDKVDWTYLRTLERYRHFVSLNANIFIRTVCLTFAFGFFYSKSSAYGEVVLAVNVVLLQFTNWVSYMIDGYAYAAESLVGKYAGARNVERLRKAIRLCFRWAIGMAVMLALVYWAFGVQLFTIFSDDDQLLQVGRKYLPWMILLPLLGYASYIWDGIFVGLTAGKEMRNTMLVAMMVYLLAYFTLAPRYENHGLWAAFMIFLLARAGAQYLVYHRRKLYETHYVLD